MLHAAREMLRKVRRGTVNEGMYALALRRYKWYHVGTKMEIFFRIPRGRKSRIFLAMRNEITIAMRYNIT